MTNMNVKNQKKNSKKIILGFGFNKKNFELEQ
jgi:hypothetical protein